jgi:hypothetical protein
VLGKEAGGIERARAGNLAVLEDAAEDAGVLGAAEADVAAGLGAVAGGPAHAAGGEQGGVRSKKYNRCVGPHDVPPGVVPEEEIAMRGPRGAQWSFAALAGEGDAIRTAMSGFRPRVAN